ncbi:MAG: DHA2 family efflux MFS transporter permease subunit [Deltaproteobacteria bacterium]|nr:DHA2 family efflux MFS transporter permease subunit [Deltaproteobacteria bacterium]
MPRVNKWLVALTVMIPTLMVIVDTSVVNVSLDHIRGSLSAGIDEATWSITSYLAANAVIIPMSGWLSRLFGRKRYLVSSVALFTVSSLFCGLAWSIQSLIIFRVLQGLAGGALQPLSQSILLETFPVYQHGMAMAIFGIGIMFGPIIGPVLGGWITDSWSWHWIFFVNVPFGIISIFMTIFFIFDPPYMKKTKMKIDYWGLILMTVGVGCLQLILDRGQREDWFSSELITWMTVACGVALVFFILVERVVKEPIVDLKVFKDATFVLGNVILFFVVMNLFGSIVMLPIYLQTLMGYTATLSGFVLGPGGIANLLCMPIVGQLVSRGYPKGLILFGILVTAYATYQMSQFNLQVDFNAVLWPRVMLGIGVAFVFIPLTTISLSHIRKEEMGNASAVFNLLRNLGGSFGVALSATILARQAQVHQAHLTEHLTPFDPAYVLSAQQSARTLLEKGIEASQAAQGGMELIYQRLLREAAMLSFNNVFYLLTVLMLLTVPLVFFMRRTPR